MKHIFIGLVFIFIACTTYAEDIEPQQRPVLATAAYVQSAYETVTNQLSVKQDTISDLATIRSGAAAGATAVQPSSLSTVATSGSYADLSGKPALATVATSGSYNDLTNKPTIPTLPTGPNDGKYRLIWNGRTGQFSFELEELIPLNCRGAWYYEFDLGFAQCVDSYGGGTSSSFNASALTWQVTFSYGTLSGIASCNAKTKTKSGATGQELQQSSTGKYCWCKITDPKEAKSWDYVNNFTSTSDCAANCASKCAELFRDSDGFRYIAYQFFNTENPDNVVPEIE